MRAALLILILMITHQSHSQTASRVILKPSENGSVTSLVDKTTQNLKVDTTNEVTLQIPALVSLEGRIPVMLLPVSEGTSEVVLNPPTVRDATASTGQKEISLIVSEVYVGIQEIQKDIQKKNLERASIKIEDLIKKYPDVSFLQFTKGSVLFLQGKKKSARRAVTKALEGHPNFSEGKEFLKAIGGPVTDGDTADE